MESAYSTNATAPEVSVIVCTYNRCQSLADTLNALASQQYDRAKWELLVVNNNSKDATADTVRAFQREHPQIACHYLFQAEQGLSHARNLGIAQARGKLILFTDDDVLPEPEWISKFVETMTQFECDACGGYVAPIWEKKPPEWLTEKFHGFLAIRMDETGPRSIAHDEDPPFGANMGFKRDVFESLGKFDTGLGRKGNVLAGGEEWDIFRRVLLQGGTVVYTPRMRVHHKVEAFRLTKHYFRRWRFQCSRNEAFAAPPTGFRRFMGAPLYLFLQLVRAVSKAVVQFVTRPADEAFRQEMIIWHFLGLISGCRQSKGRG